MPNSCNHTIHKAHSHYGWDNAFAAPVLTIAPGETVEFETVDASGGQLGPESSLEDVGRNLDFGKVNPVTGPVLIDGAEPGDALKVTIARLRALGLGLDRQHSRLRAVGRSVPGPGAATSGNTIPAPSPRRFTGPAGGCR